MYWYANNNPYRFVDPDGRLTYEAKYLNKNIKVHIPDSIPKPEQTQLKAKIDEGVSVLNDAQENLSSEALGAANKINGITVRDDAQRSYVSLSSGVFVPNTEFLSDSSPNWLASSFIHDGKHLDLYQTTPGDATAKRNASTGIEAEVKAMKVQLGAAKALGLSPAEVGYLKQAISNPEQLKSYIDLVP